MRKEKLLVIDGNTMSPKDDVVHDSLVIARWHASSIAVPYIRIAYIKSKRKLIRCKSQEQHKAVVCVKKK